MIQWSMAVKFLASALFAVSVAFTSLGMEPASAQPLPSVNQAKPEDADKIKLAVKVIVNPGSSAEARSSAELELRRLVEMHNPDAETALGSLYFGNFYLKGRQQEGLRLLRNAAETEHPVALYELGEALLWGTGVPPKPTEAVALLERATSAGSIAAFRVLGEQYVAGTILPQDKAKGESLLRTAMAKGDADAKAILGEFYLQGYYLARDAKQGLELLEQAAASKSPRAFASLGSELLTGTSLAQDTTRALKYLEAAQKAGNANAARTLGEYLVASASIDDRKRGVALLERAAERGDRRAMISLGKHLAEGGRRSSLRRALEQFEAAARKGNGEGLEWYGTRLMWRAQTAGDRSTAKKLLLEAAKSGRGTAWLTLAEGVLYKKLGKSDVKEFNLYVSEAKKAKVDRAAVVESLRHFYGFGGPKSSAKAINVLEQASAQGNAAAISYLLQLMRDGDGWSVKPNTRQARGYLRTYGKYLNEGEAKRQDVLLKARTRRDLQGFAEIARMVSDPKVFQISRFYRELFRINPNAAVYILQENLTRKSIYTGPLHGKLTKSTLSAMATACKTLVVPGGCKRDEGFELSVPRLLMASNEEANVASP